MEPAHIWEPTGGRGHFSGQRCQATQEATSRCTRPQPRVSAPTPPHQASRGVTKSPRVPLVSSATGQPLPLPLHSSLSAPSLKGQEAGQGPRNPVPASSPCQTFPPRRGVPRSPAGKAKAGTLPPGLLLRQPGALPASLSRACNSNDPARSGPTGADLAEACPATGARCALETHLQAKPEGARSWGAPPGRQNKASSEAVRASGRAGGPLKRTSRGEARPGLGLPSLPGTALLGPS